jgi:biofilm PGA synthesis protein PgaA
MFDKNFVLLLASETALWLKLTLYFMKRFLLTIFISIVAVELVVTILCPVHTCSLVYAQPSIVIQKSNGIQLQQKTSTLGDPDTVLKKARKMVKDGNCKKALSILYPFTSKPMKYPAIYSDYIVMLFWDGNADEALSLFENLPTAFPSQVYLLRNMAKAYYDKEAFLEAVSLYKKVVSQTPLDEEAQKGLVLSLIRVGDLESAFNVTNKFLKRAPESSSLLLTKAQILTKQGKYLEAFDLYRLLATREDVEAEQIYTFRDNLLSTLSTSEQNNILNDLRKAARDGNKKTYLDYMLMLTLTKDYMGAIKAFETVNLDHTQYSDYLLCWIAWAYLKTGKIEKAKDYYQKIIKRNPSYVRASIGLTYCLSAEGKSDKAIQGLEKLLSMAPDNTEIRFARAFAHEKAQRFWLAIQEYDRILELSPGNSVARKLRLQTMSDMGASSYAREHALKEFPSNVDFYDTITGDMAVDRIRWGEFKESINILSPLAESKKTLRYKYDYIIALINDKQMGKAIDIYEKLVAEEIPIPLWVLEEVAWAYLYLDQPYKALALCDEALKIQPHSFNGRMVKFYILQEIREWNMARELLNELDQEVPLFIGKDKNILPNWTKLDIALARGWFLIYEDNLREAQRYFEDLNEKAPAHTVLRNGIAHVYLLRGWPRKALEEFSIIETLEPEFYKAQTGKIMGLNELAFKEQARKEANNLLFAFPKDKNVQRLVRELKIEEMREFSTDVIVSREDDDTAEIRFTTRLSQPLSLYTKLYAFLLWQKTQYENQSIDFRRIGLGINHILNSSFDIRQQFSVNYDNGDDFGSYSLINFHPDDYWSFNFSYDSFTTDIPIRARAFDITAKKFDMRITYRESEWRSYNLSLSHLTFSDGNDRDKALIGYEQGLWVKNDWKMRLFLNLYASQNNRDDAPYFNPKSDWNLSATHVTEHTVWRILNRSFTHRLFISLGNYNQSEFSNNLVASIGYEQEHEFSETQTLLWGTNLARNVYDGESVTGLSFYLNFRWQF